MLELSIGLYIAIGLMLVSIGPVSENIAEEIDRARGTPFTNAFMEREQPSEIKLFLFRMVISIGFVTLWPVFCWGIFKERNAKQFALEQMQERSKGLWFDLMGGHGAITCKECNQTEEVTSFIHGINSSSTGFQCQVCGKFYSIRSGGPNNANEYQESLDCVCGGRLERSKVIFCPQCKSQNLSYEMHFIT